MENKVLNIIDDGSFVRALKLLIDHRLKRLLIERRTQLGFDLDLAEMARFVIVQPGNTAADLEETIGFSVFRNPADGSCLGDPGWNPGWEWIEDHVFAWELCFIMDDSGFGHVIIIPKEEGVDRSLLYLCSIHAG